MNTFTLKDIQIRDPFVLPVKEQGIYYLFGTTDPNAWTGSGVGFDCYRSRDLETWEGPIPAFRPNTDFWATTNFWAPEVHRYHGKYYLFASFKAPQHYRGTQILVSNEPDGPYVPLTDGPVTPPDWECLDGTLFIDSWGKPWIVFCHEWVQVANGAIYAMPLTDDLKKPLSRPIFLFNASEAAWVNHPGWPEAGSQAIFPTYVTDGPFLYHTKAGKLLMLWSSTGHKGYAMGLARSITGKIEGPWEQLDKPLWEEDGGHGMVFKTFEGRLFASLHRPNQSPYERASFFELVDEGRTLRLHGV